MSDFSSLEIGKRALAAQQIGLDTTNNNVANVNTPGYSRRQPVISESDPVQTSTGYVGTGVLVDKLKNFREDLFDKQIRTTVSSQSGYSTDNNILTRVETILGEPSDNGISETLSKFLNSFQDLSNNPEDNGLRNNTLELAQNLVDKFHSTSQQIQDLKNETLGNINSDIKTINGLLSQIADFNSKIAASKAQAGSDPQTLIDQRENALEDLSKLSGVSVTQGDFGTINVFMNGINVVTGTNATKLQAVQNVNSSTGEQTIQLSNMDSKGKLINYITPQSGELSSLFKHYNVTLDDKESGNGFSIAKSLDDFAGAIVNKVNSLTIGGYGLDDKTSPPPGRSFFEPAVGSATATTIEISNDIKDNPKNIPISGAPNEPGDNSIGLKIANLSIDGQFIDGQAPVDFYANVLGKIGSLSLDTQNASSTSQLVLNQLTSQRESVIGVNLDEEAINLIKYQKAFEASSRIINTTNEILTTIVNLGK